MSRPCGHVLCGLLPEGECGQAETPTPPPELTPAPKRRGPGRPPYFGPKQQKPKRVEPPGTRAPTGEFLPGNAGGPGRAKRVDVDPKAKRPVGRPKGPPKKPKRKRTLAEAYALGRQSRGEVDAFRISRQEVFQGALTATTPPPEARAEARMESRREKLEAELRRRQLEAEKRTREARASLAEFVRQAWAVLEPGVELAWNWHIEAVCLHVQTALEDWAKARDALARGETFEQPIRNLLINIPPGTAKSRIVSVLAPAWFWLHHPEWRVLCLSANPEVALRDADFAKQIIESPWYQETFQPEWQLRIDQSAKGNFGNTAGGTRVSGGITKKITGQRADAILIDDPNDAKEVHSETIRKAVNHNWDHAIRNRVNDLRIAVRIGIMQRLHEEEFSGHWLKKGVTHLCLPMELGGQVDGKPEEGGCECTDCQVGHTPIGWSDPRKDPEFRPESAYGPLTGGKVLHPERFPVEVLQDELKTLGSAGYAGQHQQRPAPADGLMFKRSWFKDFDSLPESGVSWSMYCDFNAKKTTDGSRTCIQVWVRQGPMRFLVDEFVGITSPNEAIEETRRWRLRYPKVRRMVLEDKANGPLVIEAMQREFQGVLPWSPKSDSKESRAVAVLPQVEAGNVFLPRNAPWRDGFLHELATFPNGSHDDQVDTFTMALIDMEGSRDAQRFLEAYGKKEAPKLSVVK